MTRQVPPTDPIRRSRRDFEPGPEWPNWLDRLARGAVAACVVVGLVMLAGVIWGLVEVIAYITRTR